MGLQGSDLDGEARENGDIDVRVIPEWFSVRELDKYHSF